MTNHILHHGDDSHLAFGPMLDAASWAQSVDVDAVADREWFRTHPRESVRRRQASFRECLATGCESGTIVVVSRGPGQSQIRAFLEK